MAGVNRIRQLHTVFSGINVTEREVKLDYMSEFTGRPINSSLDLKPVELVNLIAHISKLIPATPEDKMRRKIMYHARLINWTTYKDGRKVADGMRVDNWCVKSGAFHKALKEHNYKELVALVTQFERVTETYL